MSATNAAKSHCHRGHAFDVENTYRFTNKAGYEMRLCRACRKATRVGGPINARGEDREALDPKALARCVSDLRDGTLLIDLRERFGSRMVLAAQESA